jgi:hypothetical protein
MECPRVRDLLADYSVEMLEARQQRQVDAHLDGCADCREELRILNAVVVLVEEHGALNPPVGLFNGVRNRIEAGDFVRERPAWWAIFLTPPARAGAMAMAMGAVVLGLVVPTGPSRVQQPLPIHVTETSSMASGDLASSIRQHAMSAVEGPLADRVAWEAMAQIAAQNVPDEDGKPAKERRVE